MSGKKRFLEEKKDTKKEPASSGTATDSNSSTSIKKNNIKENNPSNDLEESQTFKISNHYRQPVDDDKKARHWLFIIYEESAPSDWMQQLETTGLPFCVSPLHDRDLNPTGEIKKAHWHCIVSYSNTTTYRNIKGLREITKGPFPLKCESASGSYAYFTHKNNPEKAQYDPVEIQRFNGWDKVLESAEISAIMRELTTTIFLDDIQEYGELIAVTRWMDGDYLSVAMSHTLYFDRLITSYRHNPVRILKRYFNGMEEGEDKDKILFRIQMLEQVLDEKESENEG